MKISEILKNDTKELFSFEFFPPKTAKGEQNLYKTIENLKELNPAFISITYGAGGSTRQNTIKWTNHIRNTIGINTLVHLTCIGHSKAEIDTILKQVKDYGINNILALRGDPPKNPDDTKNWKPKKDFSYAVDLIRYIKERYDFSIGAAAYPEIHPEARSLKRDIECLKRKVNSGADFLISQLFFSNEVFFRFQEKLIKAGIDIPLIPGIMPISSFDQVERFGAMIGKGSVIPEDFKKKLEKYSDDEEAVKKIGIDFAIRQCEGLQKAGFRAIHFYTLNKSPATRQIVQALRSNNR